MEARFFFTNLGRAILRAAPYLVLAAQVVDFVNRGMEDASEHTRADTSSLNKDATNETPISIQ